MPQVKLKAGYAVDVSIQQNQDQLDILAPDGKVFLRVTFTDDAVDVELSSTNLSVSAERTVAFNCEDFEVAAKGKIKLAAQKGIENRSSQDIVSMATKDILTESFAQKHIANRGDFKIEANDDVFLDGERIRLNSPIPSLEMQKELEMFKKMLK